MTPMVIVTVYHHSGQISKVFAPFFNKNELLSNTGGIIKSRERGSNLTNEVEIRSLSSVDQWIVSWITLSLLHYSVTCTD